MMRFSCKCGCLYITSSTVPRGCVRCEDCGSTCILPNGNFIKPLEHKYENGVCICGQEEKQGEGDV